MSDVVDGQQRLTTLRILLAALRATISEPSASDLTKFIYEKGSAILGTKDRFRLSLRERDSGEQAARTGCDPARTQGRIASH